MGRPMSHRSVAMLIAWGQLVDISKYNEYSDQVTYRMRPPEACVIIAQDCAFAFPPRPGLFDWNTGKYFNDESRHHEQEAVDDSPLT